MKVFRLILRLELTVQLRVDISARPDPCLGLLLGLDVLLLLLFIVKSLYIQLVLEQLVLIEVVSLLPLFDIRHLFLHG